MWQVKFDLYTPAFRRSLLSIFYHEYGGITLFRNVGTYIPNYLAAAIV